jgi:selenocysteine lyase/cysteine desulfurase
MNMSPSPSFQNYSDLVYGLDVKVPLLDGSSRRYINLDNAASTPPLRAVLQTVDEFLKYYSSVHRDRLQVVNAYEQARATVLASGRRPGRARLHLREKHNRGDQ